MGIFGSLFGKKAANVKQELHKVENRDLMEAIVAGSILVAYADGECEDAELKVLKEVGQRLGINLREYDLENV